jgi:hypothetical protein
LDVPAEVGVSTLPRAHDGHHSSQAQGGNAETTTSLAVAAVLAEKGHAVALVDVDPLSTATEGYTECPICGADANEEPCAHFLCAADTTFPYAMGSSGSPLEVYTDRFNPELLGEIDGWLDSNGKYLGPLLGPKRPAGLLEPRLVNLIRSVQEGVAEMEGERDSGADLRAFIDYLLEVIEAAEVECLITYTEDEVPMAASSYCNYWNERRRARRRGRREGASTGHNLAQECSGLAAAWPRKAGRRCLSAQHVRRKHSRVTMSW